MSGHQEEGPEMDRLELVSHHAAEDLQGGAMAKLIKDADVLQHFLYNPALVGNPALKWSERLDSILVELGVGSHSSSF
jgi:hypothetical protein